MASSKVDLNQLRQQIDQLDQQIQQLISDRARIALAVGEAKGPQQQPVDYYRPEREAQVLRAVMERNAGPLSDTEMVRLFREIMASCLAQQEPLRIAYLGPEGTFTQQAVIQHFGHAVRAVAQASMDEVFSQVQACEADFGVVPVENSTQGIVSHTLDLFLNSPLKICAEVELRIHQNLLSQAPGLGQIERVYSHPQSLSQCRLWLRDHLPNVELIPVSSNAEAARRVRHAPDAAAIAGRSAAEVYGLPVLFADIEDQPDNSTRFLVIGRELFPPSGDDKSTLLLAGVQGPGALHELLSPLAQAGINMTRIESRPSRQGKWDYVFFVDVEGHAQEAPLVSALQELQQVARMVTVLGAYPKALNTDL
ncbi:MAG: prephenate dehydratase [Xanthomonadales bacterium]|jgi:chorismate mutase/prephenate dehydratase|nr:prephenate dehydratase [Xanthomonadales bacterium]